MAEERVTEIPVIDIGPLQGPDRPARRAVDTAILAACRDAGFLVVTGQPEEARLDRERRASLMAFLDLPAEVKWAAARRKYAPDHPNLYRGYFPAIEGVAAYKEGIDLGPELDGEVRSAAAHPLVEANPWPPETLLPGWRRRMNDYYAAMERLGFTLLHALARGFGLPEASFDAAFHGGNSTLRLLRYPPRPESSVAGREAELSREHGGGRAWIMTGEHCDSGCLTLLHQDETGGLQARAPDGAWLDVPTVPGGVVVNLGDLMQRWTGGRLRATEHRVLASAGSETSGRPRESVPFFFEPAVDAVIAPPPALRDAEDGPPPLVYGDYLIEKVQRFPEFRDFLPGRGADTSPAL